MWWLGHLRVALSLPSMKMTMRMRVEQQWAMVSDSTLVLPLLPAAAPPKSPRLHALSLRRSHTRRRTDMAGT